MGKGEGFTVSPPLGLDKIADYAIVGGRMKGAPMRTREKIEIMIKEAGKHRALVSELYSSYWFGYINALKELKEAIK